jgi:hypothetical protein
VLYLPLTFSLSLTTDGQTGSGKTHSIMGNAGVEEEEGIIPRAIKDIFSTLHQEKASTLANANVRVSMIEIYNDDCKDLLHPDIPSRDIMIREDRDGRIFFTGAREEVVPDVRTAMSYLEQGNFNRTTAETLMNQTSSRSHVRFLLLELCYDSNSKCSNVMYTCTICHLTSSTLFYVSPRRYLRFLWKY